MNTRSLLFSAAFLIITINSYAQTGISAAGTPPDASAMLDVISNNQGFLAPRVALTAANAATPITLPATGLMVYNTATANTGAAAPPNDITPGYYYNAGTTAAPSWVRFVTGGTANAWYLTGNAGTTASTSAIGVTANNNFIGTTDAKDFVLAAGGYERLRIASGGNVGINALSPIAKLDIAAGADANGASDQVALSLQYRNGGGFRHFIRSRHNSGAGSGNDIDFYIATGTTAITTAGASSAPATGNIHVMTIENYGFGTTNEGRVGIGTTAPNSPLTVRTTTATANARTSSIANAANDQLFELVTTKGSTTNSAGEVTTQIGQAYNGSAITEGIRFIRGGGASDGAMAFVTNSGTERMRITSAGDIGIGVVPSGTYKLQVSGKLLTSGIDENSDARLKKEINPISEALSKVLQMRGVTYFWNNEKFPGKNFEKDIQFGLIAQELETVIPELVTTDGEGYKAIEYSHLVPVLIEAIKEQQKIIDNEKQSNRTLKAEVDKLAARMAALENATEINVNKVEK